MVKIRHTNTLVLVAYTRFEDDLSLYHRQQEALKHEFALLEQEIF